MVSVPQTPGSYIREYDQSFYEIGLTPTSFLIIGGARKGPVNQITPCFGTVDFIQKFGIPTPNDYGAYAALMQLQLVSSILYLRVANGEATSAVTVQDGSSNNVLDFEANSPGTWGDDLQVVIATGSGAGLYNVTVRGPVNATANPTIDDLESFEDVSLNSAHARYIETIINDGIPKDGLRPSEYVTVDVVSSAFVPSNGTYNLTGGNDGISGLTAADYIGTYSGQTATGLKAALDIDRWQIDMIALPGVTDPNVYLTTGGLFETLQKRVFSFGLVDPPLGLSSDDVVAWHNGSAPYAHATFNERRAGLFWSWPKIYDTYNNQELFVPPSAAAMQRFAYTDINAAPWFAAAGFSRGKVSGVIGLETSPTFEQRVNLNSDALRNNVNPIVDFVSRGPTIWGNKTLQRDLTLLNRIDNVRMLLFAEYRAWRIARELLFDKNDEILYDRYLNRVNTELDRIKDSRGLDDFRVIMSPENNPDSLRNQGIARAQLILKPTPTAERIVSEFTVTGGEIDPSSFSA